VFIVSIDLWGTLIRSSPEFVEAKVALTNRYFKNLSSDFVLECFKQTKNQLNNIIENTGWQPKETEIFTLLLTKLNQCYSEFDFLEDFIEDYQNLSKKITPQLYSDETKKYLSLLSKSNVLNLSSNTMMINGSSLKVVLDKLEISQYFSKLFFSDQVGYSKPNPIMYANSNFHIGDNPVTDGVGAGIAKSKPIIINSNKITIKDAYNIITQE